MSGEFQDVAAMLAALKPDEPVYAFRPRELRQAAQLFTTLFPGDVLYPTHANAHADFLQALYTGGIRHVAVSNLDELCGVKTSVPDASCYFLQPVKSASAIREAAHKYSVTHFAIDHADELAKIIVNTVPLKPTILIRLATPKNHAAFDPAGKYGCSVGEAAALMRAAAAEGFGVGLGFHLGSGKDLAHCRSAFELVSKTIRAANVEPEWIDIGGGFFAASAFGCAPPLTDYMDVFRDEFAQLQLHRPANKIDVSADAGAGGAGHLAAYSVELRRRNRLYLNDGIYGRLGELRSSGLTFSMRAWRINDGVQPLTSALDDFDFCGPTQDDGDRLAGPFALPDTIQMGDYIEIGQMGVHSFNRRTDFGGFLSATHVIVNDAAPQF